MNEQAATTPRREPRWVPAIAGLLVLAVLVLLAASLAVNLHAQLNPQPARTVCVYVDGAGIAATETFTVDGRCYGLDG